LPQDIYLTEDFPKEIQLRRRKLTPILALARTVPSVKSVRLIEDKLILDGKTFTEKNLHTLPKELKDKSTSTLSKDGVTAFSSASSIFSNLYPCSLNKDGHKYSSVEQYYGMQKARHATDQDSLTKISKQPEEARKISKAISMQPAVFEEWRRIRCRILKDAIKAKFMQNPELAAALKDTGDATIAEATRDRYWGIGKTLSDPAIFDKNSWKGSNMCGQILMEVRDELNTI